MAPLKWSEIKDGQLTTRIIQSKTGLTLHPIARLILEKQGRLNPGVREDDLVFNLPSQDAANKVIKA